MFIDEMKRAVATAPREALATLSASLWKSFAAGAIEEHDAQALAELIEAKKVVPLPAAPRRGGSRPRSSASLERRRRWVSSGWMPPQIAGHFTLAEAAVLAVIAHQVVKTGMCVLTIDAISALAGCGPSSTRSALREAKRLGLLTIEARRVSAYRNLANIVRVVSAEWAVWLRMSAKRGNPSKPQTPRDTHKKPTPDRWYGSNRSLAMRANGGSSPAGCRFPPQTGPGMPTQAVRQGM